MNWHLATARAHGAVGGASARATIVLGDRVHDVAEATGTSDWSDMLALLADWDVAEPAIARAAARLATRADPGRPLAEVDLLAPVPVPGDIYCAGANYRDHVVEMARSRGETPGPTMKELGELPWFFLKCGRSAVVGPGAEVELPRYASNVDWEIELVAVIGRRAKNLAVGAALGCVAGWTIANDLSARDAGRRPKNPPGSPFHHDWLSHKAFDGSCPLGPWITPSRFIADPQRLAMKLWVGDELMQDSSTAGMIFDVAEQIAMLSSRVTLHPGDLVLTGTPAGVGNARGRFLRPGETVKLWIEGIGAFEHRVR